MPLYSTEQTANFNNFDKTVSGYLGFLDNEYIQAGLALFLILYAGIIAPKLSPGVLEMFDNIFVKILAFFLIVLISKKSPTIALIAAVAVIVTLMIANNQIVIKTIVRQEQFSSINPSDNDDGYTVNDLEYYPKETQYPVMMDDIAMKNQRISKKICGINETGYDDMAGSSLDGESEMDSSMSIYANPTHQGRMFDENIVNTNAHPTAEAESHIPDMHPEPEYEQESEQSQPTIEEVVRIPVEKLAAKVEESTGEVVPEEMKQEIVEEVKQVITQKASEGQPITKDYIVVVCKAAYKNRMQ
jgi:hypothetical protein